MKLEIDHSSPVPLHFQVEQLLRGLITKEEYQKGKQLPKEVELAKSLGVARNTIRQATNKLVYEGLLDRKKGVGTFVAVRNVTTKLEKWTSFSEEMNKQGIEIKNYMQEVDIVDSDEDIANKLGISEGIKVIQLKRLRGDLEAPFVYFISYFHPRIGMNGREDFSRPLYEILECDYATVPAISREEILAVKADNEISKILKINEGDPVLLRIRQVLDPGKRVIEYNLCYYRADKFTYKIDIER